ncbi:MAG: DUF255 domain-containing protein [Thermoplasmata archaeon]
MTPAIDPTAPAWRLSRSSSAYLRAAAHQPIEWYPWGEEPFEVARTRGVPILLDIGASWCHWCHVMDEGTYADAEVARLLREHFVAVKVDRDEHPEVDRRYQREVQALSGEGGWPLTAFLTPEGRPFFGGTYFPATDHHGRPGFRRLLPEITRWWEAHRGSAGAETEEAMRWDPEAIPRGPEPPVPVEEFVGATRRGIHDSHDPVHGGFGDAPKFPHPAAIEFLLWDAGTNGGTESAAIARRTLDGMGAGGCYDQIGGGFHRYSVDEAWRIPHFEKMAADNAALLAAFADGAALFGDPRYAEIVRGTAGWVQGSLALPGGGWGASQDADNAPGDDGGYYTWTRAQLKGILDDDEFRLFVRAFGIGSEGRMPEDPQRNVLFRLAEPAEAAAGCEPPIRDPLATFRRAIAKVRAARDRRPPPPVDPALYTSGNGAMIRGFARAGALLGDPSLLTAARAAADRIWTDGWSEDRGMAHRIPVDGGTGSGHGLLEDQAEFAAGLVELAGATGAVELARRAARILGVIDREFRGEDGLLRDLAPRIYDGNRRIASGPPSYTLEDSPNAPPIAIAVLASARLGSLLAEDRWQRLAASAGEAAARHLRHAGLFGAGVAWSLAVSRTPATTVVVEGTGPAAAALLRAARTAYHPHLWVLPASVAGSFPVHGDLPPAGGDPPRALLCREGRCLPPIDSPEALRRAISAPYGLR